MLKRQAVRSTMWSGFDVIGRQGVQFVLVVCLARLLAPADFGLIAMMAIFLGIASVLMEGGLTLALIQSRDVDHVDESTIFWVNVILGVALGSVLFFAASAIARFYSTPELEPLARVLAVVPVLGAFNAVPMARLTRCLDFRTQALAGLIASIVSAIIALAIAVGGGGAWALVAQSILLTCVTGVVVWWKCAWRPKPVVSLLSLRRLGGFGGYVLASNLTEMLYSRLFSLVGGRLFGAQQLGYYANAESLRQLPSTFLGSVVARVALPTLSQMDPEPTRMRRAVQAAQRATMLPNALMMLGMVALAEPLVLVLFGEQWVESVPLLQILALAGLLYPMHLMNMQALLALGHSRLVFRLELIKKPLGVMLLVMGATHGLQGLAWSQVIFSACVLGINARYARLWFQYGALHQLRDVAVLILVAGVVAMGMRWCVTQLQLSPWLELLVAGGLGAASYVALVALLGAEAWQELRLLFSAGMRSGKDA